MNIRNTLLAILLFCGIALPAFADSTVPPPDKYEKLWKRVDSMNNKGLYNSALKVVEQIYATAKQEKNPSQTVKALIHKLKFESYTGEDYMSNEIVILSKEVETAFFPLKPIFHSILADLYWRYYQANRYLFNNRTTTVNFVPDDLKTWDLRKIVEKVVWHYMASLQNADSLKATPINVYDDVLTVYTDSRKFRPTLYDFVAHRAIQFFASSEPGLTKPADRFEIDDPAVFGTASQFAALTFKTSDSLSLPFYALKIYQDLVRFHMNDKSPEALVDLEIARLHFLRSKAILEEKDSLYLQALLNLEKTYATNPVSTLITYEIANYYYAMGSKYYPGNPDETVRLAYKKAMEICDDAVKRFPESDGAYNCKYLQAMIKNREISLAFEGANISNKPFLSLVNYKNVPEITLRAIRTDPETWRKRSGKYYGEDLVKLYLDEKATMEWTVKLLEDGDYQRHSTEIKIPVLPKGFYIILAATNKNFSMNGDAVALGNTWITDISFIHRTMEDGSIDMYVLDRDAGKSLSGVGADLWYEKYNYTTRQYDHVREGKYTSDEKGLIHIPPANDYRYFYIDFTKGDDRFVDYSFYQYKNYQYPPVKTISTNFFTDRSIYRPGQTIYFKGIVLETEGEKTEIKPNYTTTVTLYDVNYQKVSDLTLTSNEYGTISGTFTAPTGVLNGNMQINNGRGSVYFSVEEYKRPKFEVTFDKVKGSYRLNETIKVKGNAKAYAGSNVDGAEVKYRVTRNARLPYWWYWWRGYNSGQADMEIANGTAKTDEKGEFNIEFKAKPDARYTKKYDPTFTYTIYADVTDINGETRSSNTYVAVSYKSLMVSVSVPNEIDKSDKVEPMAISSTNLGGEKEPSVGTIEIYKLKEPTRLLRSKYWDKPDRYLISKEDYIRDFPNDVYADEDNMYTWEKGDKAFSYNYDSKKDSVLILDKLSSFSEGSYKLIIRTKDKYGEDVESFSYFKVYSSEGNKMPVVSYNWSTMLKAIAEPGEKGSFLWGSSAKDVNAIYEWEHKGKIVKSQWLTVNDEQSLFEIPIGEEYRGNISMHIAFIKNNRPYTQTLMIVVPYTNKEIDFEFSTFRNKLLPGQKEEWKVKLKGKNGEKLVAEMLATMYDASLDAFKPHNIFLNLYQSHYASRYWQTSYAFRQNNTTLYSKSWNSYPAYHYKYYDYLNWFGFYYYDNYGYGGGYYDYYSDDRDYLEADEMNMQTISTGSKGNTRAAYKKSEGKAAAPAKNGYGGLVEESVKDKDVSGGEKIDAPGDVTTTPKVSGQSGLGGGEVQVRKNFNETAFFLPHLETDAEGTVTVSFTAPEALTRWKFMGLATTKDLKVGTFTKEVVTQKDLMILSNPPRFFREGDKLWFSAKVSNMAQGDITGDAQLLLFDATTMKPIDVETGNSLSIKTFTAKKGQSAPISWGINIPDGISAITYRVVARAGAFSDGEEMIIPVLTNRMLVTETLPLPIRGKQTKDFTFQKLIDSKSSSTLKNFKLTLEYTSHPFWYAIQALPYLFEYPYECSEQIFSRYYANSIASHIVNSSPKIKAVFDSWKNQTPDALLSNLEKNQELKAVFLQETPWVMDAKNESQRKQNIALLFDLNRMANELDRAIRKLEKYQCSNGGWPWFPGMPDDRYITQHVVTGMGHLQKLGVIDIKEDKRISKMVDDAIKYLDNRIREDYEWILKWDKEHINDNHTGSLQIQYLYARSYFLDKVEIASRNKEAFNYYKGQSKKYWLDFGRYLQGMIALAHNRMGDKVFANDVLRSFKDNAIYSEEMGMYWKKQTSWWYWYEAPIETQALMIEAFDEIANDQKTVDELKIWLIKQKQTQNWETTKATVEACYALLLRGTDFLQSDALVDVTVGNIKVEPKKMDNVKVEAGTGYFKTSWSGGEIVPEMGKVKVSKSDEGVGWGAIYWQYFEQLDKITPAETPLKINKKLFVERQSKTGPVMEPIVDGTKLKVGDKVKVRIEIRVDRDMEYVHMKDMRASGFEPINVMSSYKYQGGLGYYESTGDVATNFFFGSLQKGTYVFEYPLRASLKGDFSNGITSIQCMYAPEFTSHSEGIRVIISE